MNATELRAAYDSLTPEQQAAACSEALAVPVREHGTTLALDGRDFTLRVSFLGGAAKYRNGIMNTLDAVCLQSSRFVDDAECRKEIPRYQAAVRAALIAAVQRLATPDTITHNGATYWREVPRRPNARLVSITPADGLGTRQVTFEVNDAAPFVSGGPYAIVRVGK